ncbi:MULTISPECIES: SDR family oxidoreductase [unclassified Pseudoalteromonas]|uniref:SDR family oxidoreductase n=1 Tax=unclassified Pseudoalteromonas TaxID=194690 RepID=UPI000C0732DF|nr:MULTISPECIES: SDR family oxidoreductase [unclassified Pseudoalteromonas]MDP2634925.1 SDR family oxidoreductase [Pseudoalteromonas sp. 1_MG-2023]PHN89166.1 oxidoreductase [Pseudoalteromonas sp. 3D05]
MNRTLIIGASGQIGKQLTQNMLNEGQHVVALVRDEQKLSDIKSENMTIVEADLTDDFSHAFKGCSTVVFVAGSGGNTGADKTILIDLWAACRAADYAKQHDIKHFIMVSSIGADAPAEGPEEMQPYLVAKHMADEHLMHSGLRYSIIRPGTLTNNKAHNGFTTQRPSNKDEAIITRADVAKALSYCVAHQAKSNTVKELFNGAKHLDEVMS